MNTVQKLFILLSTILLLACGGGGGDSNEPSPNKPQNHVPTANAGDDQTVLSGAHVSIKGTGTDADKDPLTFHWQQLSGDSLTLIASSDEVLSFNAPIVEQETHFRFELTVADHRQGKATDTVTITVKPKPSGPQPTLTVDLGLDHNTHEKMQHHLAANITTLNGAKVVAYKWEVIEGVVNSPIVDQVNYSFIAPTVEQAKKVVIRLTVTDQHGQTYSDDVTFTINPLPAKPHVEAGENQTVIAGETVTLTGTFDSTLEGTWFQDAGTKVTLAVVNSHTVTFTAPDLSDTETLRFELLVKHPDHPDQVSNDAVYITIKPKPTLSFVLKGPRLGIEEGKAATIHNEITLMNGETLDKVTWTQTQGETVTIQSQSDAQLTFIAPNSSEQTPIVSFSVTVKGQSGVSVTESIDIHIFPKPKRPIVDAGPNKTILSNHTTYLLGSVKGNVAVQWEQVSGPQGKITSPNTQSTGYIAPKVTEATQVVLQLWAYNAYDREIKSSDEVTITVLPIQDQSSEIALDLGSNLKKMAGEEITFRPVIHNPYKLKLSEPKWQQTLGSNVLDGNSRNQLGYLRFRLPRDAQEGDRFSFKYSVTTETGNVYSDDITITIVDKHIVINDIVFTDAAMKACVLENAERHRWTTTNQVDNLNCESGHRIQHIDDLSHFDQLSKLKIASRDLTQFDTQKVPELRHLNLSVSRDLNTIDFALAPKLNHLTLVGEMTPYQVDLSPLSALRYLRITWLKIDTFDIQSNTFLEHVSLMSPSVRSLDFSQQQKLVGLTIYNAKNLAELVVEKKPLMRTLLVSRSALTSVDVSSAPSLDHLWLFKNTNLTALDLTENTVLTGLIATETGLTELNVGHLGQLTELNISGTRGVVDLDITPLTVLETLNISNTGLKGIDLSKLSKLKHLEAAGMEWTEIDLSHFDRLETLYLANNLLSGFDFTDAKTLRRLDLSNNKLESFDASGTNQLVYLNLANNQLTDLTLSQDVRALKQLRIDGNNFAQFELPNLENLQALTVAGVNIDTLNLTLVPKLRYLDVSNTPLTSLEPHENMTKQDSCIIAINNQLTDEVKDALTQLARDHYQFGVYFQEDDLYLDCPDLNYLGRNYD
ncbi:leucine-rich repeat domain-containing protein [Thaumasiovibrio subtropicus]|uniref:leucine-rich repeat domain-containing protein n=1 Tax=Thaumasiovibrio subtropicus TaxID=1891207 RepID=UPI000B34FC19|nr:leucine-rich repeat domain-containing protein [Thaumasiovibrio subtropicus]